MAGLDVEWPRKTPEATAMALREIVLGLPELALGAANATPALASDARAAVASDGQYEARGRERESTPEAAPAPEVPTCESPLAGQPDAAGQALLAQFYETEFDTLGDADFASYATEFAARARHYQQTHPGAQIDIASKIIRPLTAMTYKRDLPQRLFGLSREDVGEWEAIANRAREARERRDKATISGALTHRMLLPSTLVLAEAAPTGAEEGEDIDDKSIDLPALRALAEQGEIAIVGGLLGNERLEHWNRRAGIPFNWVKVDDRKLAAVTRLTTRIRGGRVVALVILTGVLNHKAYEPLIAAARAVDLPVGYARAAGQAELVTVLTDLDRRVRSGGTRDGESGALAE